MPPGGVQYVDPRTPAAQWTDDHTFLDDRARQVLTFRHGNPNVYPEPEWNDLAFIREQISVFNCARLNYEGTYCYEGGTYVPPTPPGSARICSCNAQLVERRAACCGGRLLSYDCPQCGKSYPV
jgi:hypothetical protein